MEFSGIHVSIWFIFIQPLFLLFLFSSASSRLAGNEVDRLSLLAFKAEIVTDTLGILSSWNESVHFCRWPGITCGRKHQRVTVLNLRSSKMVGHLSPHIGNLSFLRALDLHNNNFSHTIPPEIGRLFRLEKLFLDNNSFSGHIPFNISRCSNLQFLSLYGNTVSGELPTEIASLSKLRVLALGKNNFYGKIPPSFGNLSSLEILSAFQNNLHGGIPNSLGRLKSLVFFSLATNYLNGTIPPSIYNLSSIKVIYMLQNNLHGTLPLGLGHTKFPNLETFVFHTNQFTGLVPTSISNASNLSVFSISSNKFIGKVPSLARLSNLYLFQLDDNNLGNNEEGDLDFISSLVNCTNLEFVSVGLNNFGGVLPESISNLSTKLKEISFHNTQTRGSIPIRVGNLINLERLGFFANLLAGTIPSSIGKLNKLYDLFLGSNELSGNVPSSLGNLTSLSGLNLRSNKLNGSIPQSLRDCRFMLELDLSHNNLSGPIPKQVINLLVYLNLSGNQLTESIPMEGGNLQHLVILDVSENKLSGEIPQSLGSCTSLTTLSLRENLLQGIIPKSLSYLRGIEDFDLSCNNLSGIIPNYLGSFPFLQNLNLSFNNFEGAVPIQGVFKNASAVSVVGNTQLCGGIPHFRLPKCISTKSKQGLSPKLNLIISVSCGVVGLVLVLLLVLLHRSRKARALKSTSGSSLGVSLLKLSYGDLLKATDGFSASNLIGSGSFGSVYKGILSQHEERNVAVKVLNLQTSRASRSFISECEALKSIRHRNLVKLLTACSSIDFQGNDFKALVYEFMVNGSLDEWLHISAEGVDRPANLPKNLNLTQRVNIAIDVACALDYLHIRSHMPIVHCDIKPSNILLDSEMTACVGDFGLARYLRDASCPSPLHDSSSNVIKGTIGYTPPEYGMGGEVSRYGDVYSYGILLLEMLTGKRPTDDMFNSGMDLHNFVMMAQPERVGEICDPLLVQIEESSIHTNPRSNRGNNAPNDRRKRVVECLTSIARVGIACSVAMPRERKDMSNVVAELSLIRDVLTGIRMPREYP
ncbi:LRR receptor-like serine/threonine-protein kinase [Pyrus ussuriensis x Pyrus communis]|uniref:non-specific serine/threonine protein kinase n=1 Tax=Pyrus ussuriensis x Pyrus communis TaxID=2448454 RepID=A0A5N5F2B7_9ROSA|nr:LRR receptor-like serine/threonine-protein kinase [Pyrus ussuriensis x Pyrus communis]